MKNMSKIKKVIHGGFEIIKDSARQLAKTVSPDEMAKQALGQQKSEFSQFLKDLSPDTTPEQLENKKQELAAEDQKKLEEERKKLQLNYVPEHMKLPPKPKEPRPYEAAIQGEERKKAAAVEAQKKSLPMIITPTSKQSRGMLFAKKKQPKGIEGLQKDAKAG